MGPGSRFFTSNAISKLSELAAQLRKSVAGFKLPGVSALETGINQVGAGEPAMDDSNLLQDADDLAALGLEPEAAE